MDADRLIEQASRTTRRVVLATLGALAVMAAILIAERAATHKSMTASAEVMRSVSELAGEILREDEILTSSANLYAATGDVRWRERYQAHLPVIDTAIARATRLAPPDVAARFAEATKVANDALVAMEENAFAQVERGNLAGAQRELQSDNYTRYKRILASGQDDLVFDLRKFAADRAASVRRTSWAITGALILLLGGALCWTWLRLLGDVQRAGQAVRNAKDETARLLQHDRLTGLPNREWVQEQLARKMADRSRAGSRFAVLEIGVDDLRTLNTEVGYAAGDDVLVTYTERLRRYVRQDELVARLEGDHFLVVLTMDEEDRAGVARAAERLLDVLGEPVASRRFGELLMSASIGIVMYPENGVEVDDLLRHAHCALGVAKQEGRGYARFFRTSMLASTEQPAS